MQTPEPLTPDHRRHDYASRPEDSVIAAKIDKPLMKRQHGWWGTSHSMGALTEGWQLGKAIKTPKIIHWAASPVGNRRQKSRPDEPIRRVMMIEDGYIRQLCHPFTALTKCVRLPVKLRFIWTFPRIEFMKWRKWLKCRRWGPCFSHSRWMTGWRKRCLTPADGADRTGQRSDAAV